MHREPGSGALEAGRIVNPDQHVRGEFLQVTRHSEQNGRRDLEERCLQILGILAEVRNEPRNQRQRHRHIAAEHVTDRQVRDRTVLLRGERGIVADDVRRRSEMSAVRDQGSLRMAGRAGCIDDEGRCIGRNLRRAIAKRVEIGRRLSRKQISIMPDPPIIVAEHRSGIEHHDPTQGRQPRCNRQKPVDIFLVFRNEQDGAAVTHLIFDLGGRRGRVDAVDDGAQRLRRQIAYHPVFAGIAHDRDAVAAYDAKRRQGVRRACHHGGVVAPGAFAIKAEFLGAKGDRVRLGAGALAQQEWRGFAAQHVAIDLLDCGHTAARRDCPGKIL